LKILADENIANNIKEFLAKMGYEVSDYPRNELYAPDLKNILNKCLSFEAAFMFHNKYFYPYKIPDFSYIKYGVIHIIIDPPVVEKAIPILQRFFHRWKDKDFAERYVIIGNDSYRIIDQNKDETFFYY
jgi:hypothetical protein